MIGPFYKRLGDYYLKVASVLRGEAGAASIFPNSSDIGTSRENVYAEFLRQHAPSKCNVFLGGFVFGDDGSESGQLDVLITTDTAPRFDFLNQGGNGKSFSPVEGTLGVASIKSTLDKNQLENALSGIAKIPPTVPLGARCPPQLKIPDYDNWPYKIIYASDGISLQTLLDHLNNYYEVNSTIPLTRRPDVIHVAGKYVIFKGASTHSLTTSDGKTRPVSLGEYVALITHSDVQAIVHVLDELQVRATLSTHILFSYRDIVSRVNSSLAGNG